MTPYEASQRYHWVKYIKEKNTIELYLDNYMLSGARICESSFTLEHLLWVKPKYDKTKRRPWFLDFGVYIHYCLELFYNHFKMTGNPPIVDNWISNCKEKWIEMKMSDYAQSDYEADRKKLSDIGDWEGVAGLLIEYYAYYMSLRVRVIDTEITFGHDKEVPIGSFMATYKSELWPKMKILNPSLFKPKLVDNIFFVNCYLTGRIDLLVDNGYKIGPVDHKTTHKFDGFEHLDFNPHDGITGYILAINELLKKYREQGLTNIPITDSGWIYHISATRPSVPRDKTKKQGPRFKVTPIGKNTEQLIDYKKRQLSTFKRIAELLFNNKVPEWNTTNCNNMFFRPCNYKAIHEQPSTEWESTIDRFYEIGNPWDTRKFGEKNNKEKEK